MGRIVVAICVAAGLVMGGLGIANAAVPTRIGSTAGHQIRVLVKEDPDDDWLPRDRVIGVFNSRCACLTTATSRSS
jgi:hypothetical protein